MGGSYSNKHTTALGASPPGPSNLASRQPTPSSVRSLKRRGLAVLPCRVAGVVGGESCRFRYPNGDEVEFTVFDCIVSSATGTPETDETRCVAYFEIERLPPLAFRYPPEIFARPDAATYFAAPEITTNHPTPSPRT